MNRSTMQQVLYAVFNECDALRQAGQAEYAHDDREAFANFNRVAESLNMDRKQILLVYALKHWDGVCSFVAGNVSQREDVTGRINDLIVYLGLLRGMIEEERGNAGYFEQLAAQYLSQHQPVQQAPPQPVAHGTRGPFGPFSGPRRVPNIPLAEGDVPFVADPRD